MSYPVPRRSLERELQGTGAGELREYRLSDKELEALRARTAAPPTNSSGRRHSKPISLPNKPPTNRLMLDQYLQKRASGKSKQEICKEHGIVKETLKTKLSKWGILQADKEAEAIRAYKTKAETP
ncbi:hypothetical protein SAMN05421868_10745 [Paenibacillus naphthalenovorans]|nr:hypothetical protein SAMN05421868_10745 [Paenibacillus naphthalenovorans]